MARILYLDDESKNLEEIPPQLVASAARRGVKLEVDTALGVAEAEAKLASGQYDALVLDYDLGKTDMGYNGVNYAETLRKRGIATPMVLFTKADPKYMKQGHPNFDSLDMRVVTKDAGMLYNLLHPILRTSVAAVAPAPAAQQGGRY